MIQVAYDLSFVSQHYRRLNFEKFGIYQVADQVLQQILNHHSQTIGLGITSLCSTKLYDSFVGHALLTYDALKSQNRIKFEPCFRSKIGKIDYYNWLYNQLYSDLFKRKNTFSSKVLRGTRKLILYILYLYQKWNLEYDFKIKNYDIFHSIYLGLPSPEVTQGMKRVLTIHDLIPLVRPDLVSQEWIQGFKKDILSTILKDQDFIICVSNHTKQQVCEHLKIPPSRVFVTPLGASSCFYYLEDKPDIYYQSQLSKITEKPYFLGTASPEPRKNTQFLINCFCDLIQSQFNLEINLVLVGSLQPSQIEYINNINQKVLRNTKSRIYCTDYVSDQDLNLLYNQSVAFVFPSLYEGFGLPVLEALQCGTPVICSNVTALPEVVGNAAVLIDPKNSDALKQAMLDVLNDSEFRSSLSLKAIHRARAFSWKKCADRTVEAYHSIVQDY